LLRPKNCNDFGSAAKTFRAEIALAFVFLGQKLASTASIE
jgi:hypothetical protein